MSLFGSHLFGDAADTGLAQVTLPEPASDALFSELARTGGSTTPARTVEPGPEGVAIKPAAGSKMLGGSSTTWVPYALVGGGVVFAGLLIWSATRRPVSANRRKRRRSGR